MRSNEADETLVGDGDLADRGKGGEGGGRGDWPTVDVPGDGPDLGVDVLQQAGLAHVFFEDGAGDGGERLHGDKDIGSGGLPGRAVLRESTARNDVVEVGVVRELPAPGMEDARATRAGGADATFVCGQPLASRGRRLPQGLVREALLRAEEGSACRRDGAGEQDVRPGPRCVQVVREPWLGCRLLTLWAVPVATGVLDAVVLAPPWARREAVAVGPALARVDGAHDRARCEGQRRGARKVCWRTSRADLAEGGHGRRPCMRAVAPPPVPLWSTVRCRDTTARATCSGV